MTEHTFHSSNGHLTPTKALGPENLCDACYPSTAKRKAAAKAWNGHQPCGGWVITDGTKVQKVCTRHMKSLTKAGWKVQSDQRKALTAAKRQAAKAAKVQTKAQ